MAYVSPATTGVGDETTAGYRNTLKADLDDHQTRIVALEGRVLGYAQVTAPQSGITAETALTDLSVDVIVAAGQMVEIHGSGPVGGNTLDGRVLIGIKEGATSLQNDPVTIRRTDFGTSGTSHPVVILTPTAGSHTYFLVLTGSGTTGSLTASAGAPAFILVKSIGAAA